MRNQIKNSTVLRVAVVILWLLRFGLEGFAQGSAAQTQPIKKTNTTSVISTNTTKRAPSEKQPIQPGKSKTTPAASTPTNAAQAQPIQQK